MADKRMTRVQEDKGAGAKTDPSEAGQLGCSKAEREACPTLCHSTPDLAWRDASAGARDISRGAFTGRGSREGERCIPVEVQPWGLDSYGENSQGNRVLETVGGTISMPRNYNENCITAKVQYMYSYGTSLAD